MIDRRMRADGSRRRDVPHQRVRRQGLRRRNVDNWAKETISPDSCSKNSTRSCSPAAPRSRATCRCRAANSQGVHFAMEFLPQQNKVNAGDKVKDQIMATGKHVVVIGGGDTGSDCVGTSNRHGAHRSRSSNCCRSRPEQENKPLVWPYWPIKLRTSSSHEEGCERDWAVATKRFEGKNGKVEKLIAARVEWKDGKMQRSAGFRIRDEGRPGAAGDGLRRRRCSRCSMRSASTRMRAAMRKRDDRWRRLLPDVGRQGVRRRRHAARPVAGRVGDPRRPPVRARGR